MAPDSLLVLSLGVLLAFLLGVVQKHRDPLRGVPGPRLARWSCLWLAYHARRGRRFRAVHDAHRRYGPYVRISPRHVSIADATAIPVVYGQFGAGALQKSQYYDAFVAGTPSVFSVRDNTLHAQKRRLLAHAFSMRSLHGFAPLVHAMVETFVHKLDALCDTQPGSAVDMMEWFNYLTFDIISDLAFGEPLGMVDKGSDVIEMKTPEGRLHSEHAIELVEHREHLAAVLGTMPGLAHLAWLFPDPFFVRGRASAHGLAYMARKGVLWRLATGCAREDILNKLIASRVEDGGGALSDVQVDELTAEAVTILIAGTHTGASSMAAILHLVRRHDQVYTALMTELETLGLGPHEVPTYAQLRHLPYLQATITEGLRLHATNAIGLPRSAPSHGVEFCGRVFPAGTELSVPAWTIQHDEELWGDPFTFRPERWLVGGAPELRRYMLSFGAGPRTCLGKHIANMEMQVILAALLLRYDIILESYDLATHEGFQHQPIDMRVTLSRRQTVRH